MGRQAQAMLGVIERVVREMDIEVLLSVGAYSATFDEDRITEGARAILAQPFGEPGRLKLLRYFGDEIVRALLLDLAEEQGTHLNPVRDPEA